MNAFTVIIPAAGVGSRFGFYLPKQYFMIQGRSVLQHTIDIFAQNKRIKHIAVISASDDIHIDQYVQLPSHGQIYPIGGATRAATVANALNHLLTQQIIQDDDMVLVHDAARCCLKQNTLNRLLDALPYPHGAILAMPVSDTIKQQSLHDNTIAHTIPRSGLWQAQTPQAFPAQLLQHAFAAAQDKQNITDEASAIETLGFSPLLIQGDRSNLKLTFADDVTLFEWLLGQREQ